MLARSIGRRFRFSCAGSYRLVHATTSVTSSSAGDETSTSTASPTSPNRSAGRQAIEELVNIIQDSSTNDSKDGQRGRRKTGRFKKFLKQQKPKNISSHEGSPEPSPPASTEQIKKESTVYRHKRSVATSLLFKTCDMVEDSLDKGSHLSDDEKLSLAHNAFEEITELSKQYEWDDMAISSLLLRCCRIIKHPKMALLRDKGLLKYENVLQHLVNQLDTRLQTDINPAQTDEQGVLSEQQATDNDNLSPTTPAKPAVDFRAVAFSFMVLSWLSYPLTPTQIDRIIDIISRNYDSVDITTIPKVLDALTVYRDRPEERELFSKLFKKVSEMSVGELKKVDDAPVLLVEVLSNVAQIGEPVPPEFVNTFKKVVHIPDLNLRQLHDFIRSSSKLNLLHGDILRDTNVALWHRLDTISPEKLNQILSYFAKSNTFPGGRLLHAIGAHFMKHLSELQPTTITHILGSYRFLDWNPRRQYFYHHPNTSLESETEDGGNTTVEIIPQQQEDKLVDAVKTTLFASNSGAVVKNDHGSIIDEQNEDYSSSRPVVPMYDLWELQREARQRQYQRRHGLAELLSSSASPSSTSSSSDVFTSGSSTSKTSSNSTSGSVRLSSRTTGGLMDVLSASNLVEKVAHAQAQRSQLEDILQYAESIVWSKRQEYLVPETPQQQSVSSSSSSGKRANFQQSKVVVPPKKNEIPKNSSTDNNFRPSELNTRNLVQAILTGDRISLETAIDSSIHDDDDEEAQATVVRLGDNSTLATELTVDPVTGRAIYQPHYDISDLFLDQARSAKTDDDDEEDNEESDKNLLAVLFDKMQDSGKKLDDDTTSDDDDAHEEEVDDAEDLEQIQQVWLKRPSIMLYQLIKRATDLMPQFTPRQAYMMLIHTAFFRHRDTRFTKNVLDKLAENKFESLRASQCVTILWAFAVLSIDMPQKYMDMLLEKIFDKSKVSDKTSVMTTTAWALTTLNRITPSILSKLIDAIPPQHYPNLSDSNLSQLYQAAVKLEMDTKKPASSFLPPALWSEAQAAWKARCANVSTSKYQKDIAAAIRSIGLHCELEHIPREKGGELSPLMIDVAVYGPDGIKIAVEVDGPHHFTSNKPKIALGSTRFRNALLRHHGWKVVSIRVEEWEIQDIGSSKWQEYLRKLVADTLREK